jgi:hypothetical protein
MVGQTGMSGKMKTVTACTIVALNIFSMPAGNTVVGRLPAGHRVFLMDGSLMRDWVFIGKWDAQNGVSPRGWVKYEYLGQCSTAPGCVTSEYGTVCPGDPESKE